MQGCKHVGRNPRRALSACLHPPRQAESNLSIPDQQRQLNAYCATKGLEAKRAAAAVRRSGANLTADLLTRFAEATRIMLRGEKGGYRRDLLKAVALRLEMVSKTTLRISGCKGEMLKTISASSVLNRRL